MKKIFYMLILMAVLGFGSVYMLNSFFFVSKADQFSDNRFIINNGTENVVEVIGEVILKDEGNTIYVPLEFLVELFDIKADYDKGYNIATITTLDKVIRFYGDGGVIKINYKEEQGIPSMLLDNETPFIPISHLEDYLNIESVFIEKTNTIILTNLNKDRSFLEVSKDQGRLRSKNRLFSQVLLTMPKNEKLQLIENDGKWLKVLTEQGHIGYINSSAAIETDTIESLKIPERAIPWPEEAGKILLAWEHVYSKNPDTSQIGDLKGLNVISPTWISLKDETGAVTHKIDSEYIQWAKQRDYQVWALFDNQFNPDVTNTFLNDAVSRERAIIDVLKLIKDYNMDGLNIDFENVYLKDREKLVQFVRELVPVFHENNLVVSMDVTVKSMAENWSLFYDRKALGEVLDYMAIMAYDEHWAASPKSGSVASIGWVERGIVGILEDVPPEKLLLGMPLYTRIWTETPTDQGVKVTSKSVGMETVNNIIAEYDLEKVWDEAAGQYYVEYKTGEKTNKIWIEDAESMKLKYDLVHKYNLAGAALWRRGFETPNIWDALDGFENSNE